MKQRIGAVVLECVLDLGITVVYAVLAGLLIVAVVSTDNGVISTMRACLYASLLPGAVLLLIGGEIASRLVEEWRLEVRGMGASRRASRTPLGRR